MDKQRGYTTLIIMVAAAVVFLAIGFLVIRKNMNSSPPTPVAQQSTSNLSQEQQQQTPASDQIQPTPAAVDTRTVGWKTYANAKYGYQVLYPPNLKVGSISGNSVLGDYQNPVRGFHVGPLVFVSLTGSLRKTGSDLFNESYNLALHPPAQSPDIPAVECKIDKINNPTTSVKSVSCAGEGGPSKYALIAGKDYDVFVDGYSKGFDNVDNGELVNSTDYANILASFKFASSGNTTTDATPPPTPPAAVQSFTIMADDTGATPSEIAVLKGTIVDLTFNVSASNVYHGGLEFKSSVINTGTIASGASKTVAFTADQSFEFTPYWPANGVKKDYTIKVTVQ